MSGRDDIRLVTTPATLWSRLELWHKAAILVLTGITAVFTAGVAFQKAKAAVVLAATQKVVDDRQDQAIRAVQDDAGRMHVTMDDLHDEVRGMRMDLRYFDPRMRGGGLGVLPEESPRFGATPTPTQDPSMALPLASPRPEGTP